MTWRESMGLRFLLYFGCVCVIDWQIGSVFVKKEAGTHSEEQRFLSSDDTTRVCQLDKYKRTIQSSRNKSWCTSPSQAIWSIVAASLTAAERWSTFDRAWAVSPHLHLQSTSDKQSYFSQLPVSSPQAQKYIHVFSLSLCLCGRVKGFASVTWYRRQSCCLSLLFTKRCTTVSSITQREPQFATLYNL